MAERAAEVGIHGGGVEGAEVGVVGGCELEAQRALPDLVGGEGLAEGEENGVHAGGDGEERIRRRGWGGGMVTWLEV